MWKKLYNRIIEARMAQVKRMLSMYDDYRALAELNNLTDNQLRDIGITRHEIPKHIFKDQ